jgi:hypothetical protein
MYVTINRVETEIKIPVTNLTAASQTHDIVRVFRKISGTWSHK